MLSRKLKHVLAAAALLLSAGSRLPAQPSTSVLEYPDHEGTIEWTGTGSNGGFFRIKYEFRGFFVIAGTPLSGAVALGQGAVIPPGLEDFYQLVPKHTTVSGEWSLSETSSFERPGVRTDCWVDQHAGSDRKTITSPDRATLQAIVDRRAPAPDGFNFPVSMIVKDRRPAQGDVRLSLQVTSVALGNPNGNGLSGRTVFTDYEGPGNVDRTEEGPHHFNYIFNALERMKPNTEISGGFVSPGGYLNLTWDHPEEPLVLGEFSPEHMGFSGEFTAVVPPNAVRKPCSYVKGDDGPWKFTLTYRVQLRKKIDVTVTPADSAESAWAPEPGQARLYQIKIIDPKPEEISRLRVSLVDTSRHKGVATNLRNHGLPYGACPDCIAGMHTVTHSASEEFGGKTVTRNYQQVDLCPIDTLPDLFFRDADNPGFTLEDPVGEGLKYKLAQSIVLDRPAGTDYVVRVEVRDGAASARLKAEVEIGGVWLPARAEGDTADSDGESLMLPVDGNRNGIHDAWENAFHVSERAQDDDATPNPAHRGDGLTAFEEYRGIYEEQKFVRTDPTRKNLFVHDPSWSYHRALLKARDFYRPLGLDVMLLGENEFWSDVVNYNETPYKQGDQYQVVVMQNPVLPSDVGSEAFAESLRFAASASYVGPPVREHHMLAMQYRLRERWPGKAPEVLEHELGHMMGIPHHGDKDFWTDVPAGNSFGLPAGETLVALEGGQHSGAAECVMRYRAAPLFSILWRPHRWAEMFYRALPAETIEPTTLCANRSGTGVNAAGAWAGDATNGNCVGHLRVRSW